MSEGATKGGKKLRRHQRIGRRNARKIKTTQHVQKRRREFERNMKDAIANSEGGKKINLQHHLAWSIGMRRRYV